MSEATLTKFITATVLAALTVYLKAMAIPILILICFMGLDYATGIAAAWVNKELCSKTGIIGILKKVCYLVMIAVGMGADWVIQQGLGQIGITIELSYAISMIITIWLLINELISIMENVAKINGDTTPRFIGYILKRLKSAVEDKLKDGDEE